jgi:site-specific DNA-methyltransferase (adenine-specific)
VLVEKKRHVPDILDCIANLSSDEVFTPPEVANQVLDLLPKALWTDPNIKILDPCCKTGIFLRESARRLMIGLEKTIPDEEKRREHIFNNMLFGIAITELTGLVSRRSLYYSKDASSEYSIVQFKDPDGNISYKRTEHDYVQGKCRICGSPYENLERGDSMENYAYQFIHEEEALDMKFDVIIGNPPYQVDDGGAGRSASPIYHLFVNQAFRLKPRYVSMIIPSRWFAGGKGLDSFREQMLASTQFRNLVDFPNSNDIFQTVKVEGGVCYFLWDEKYDGRCKVETVNGADASSPVERFLGEHGDVFVRFNEALPILEKVQAKSSDYLDKTVSARKPFGMPTNFKEFTESTGKNTHKVYANGGAYRVDIKHITNNVEWLPKWKVLVSNAYGISGGYPHQIIGKPIVAEPGSCCTETYIVTGVFETQTEAENFSQYLQTRFVRFLIALRKNTQHLTQSRFAFVPAFNFSNLYTDEKLYKHFNITQSEILFIDSIVREMSTE